MTDTTDIKALREKYELALKDLTERLMECNRLNYCMDEITAFAAFSSTLIDQLEAERQRADNLVLQVNTQANMREKAEKEWNGVVKNYNRVTDERNSAIYEVEALKAKLANPVVLGSSDVMSRNFAIKAINSAGFTVKGE